ncbi:MAG: sulfate adenylyltransferase subunit CysN [Acidimicrobiia bacterium]
MSHRSELIADDILAYLEEHERKDLLRFLTCGSVDDGKSTLIGRLLHDSKLIYEDQLAAVEADSTTSGSVAGDLDLALLMDGLKAEREQGITIDVAYRYFSTARRKFIIADTPGHEQYTRNMVTGASTCQLAIILIDARHGVQAQTKRHSFIASLLGIDKIVVAVNKMDLVDWSEERFREIADHYTEFMDRLDITEPYVIPMSALKGDGVVEPGDNMGWFEGPPLMEYLETVPVGDDREVADFRFPVQMVLRPDLAFRGFAGTVSSGVVRPGDEVVALPSGKVSTVERIVTFDGDLDAAGPETAVTITLTDEIDLSRGDMLVHPENPPRRAHDVDAMVVWMAEEPMVQGREYLVRQTTSTTTGRISSLQHRVDINTLETEPAPGLELNEIGRCTVSLDREILFDPYAHHRHTGSFILVDRLSNATVGAGMIVDDEAGWSAVPDEHLTRHTSAITPEEREARYGQRAVTVFLTGLTGSGKSAIATALERKLFAAGRGTIRLDGENMRLGVSRDLGFTSAERSENVRRAAEMARLVNDQGLICIAALVAPRASVREKARELIGGDRFIAVYLDAPVDVCRDRDDSGVYEAADRGEIAFLPGVSAPYEVPIDADLVLDTVGEDVGACVDRVVALLDDRGFLNPRRNTT